ncbi:c-type cytochrome [Pedobacter gandavensis]|uniref:C-type cytochrome n=1 Tax=Pedobacter gandavensis TaxID=2679963 RepID=A0ABR6F2U4_9SPHI|nr:c-type cytochrome [Pedobacter gandavensis]MBB2151825.1 c-type cytochrome [Pedobacter gandavensis]
MKNTLFILACFIMALASCGSPESNSTSTTATTETTAAASATTEKHPGEKLIATSDCIGCHNKVTKVIGPTYEEIAAKYTLNDATVEQLSKKIIEGGKGVWGEVPMTPHANLSQDDAKEMVRYILSLKK